MSAPSTYANRSPRSVGWLSKFASTCIGVGMICTTASAQPISGKACKRPDPDGFVRHVTGRVSIQVGGMYIDQRTNKLMVKLGYRPRNEWCVVRTQMGNRVMDGDDAVGRKCNADKWTWLTDDAVSQLATGESAAHARSTTNFTMDLSKGLSAPAYEIVLMHNDAQIVGMCM